jgi:hypothetical protein
MTDVFGLEFETPAGETLYFEWNPDSLGHLDGELGDPTPWQLEGELDWDEVDLIRVLSARFDDGRLLGLAALRPAGAAGHGEEIVVSALVDPEGRVEPVAETLLSVEYDGSGLPRRAGLELYRGEGSIPLRVAGNATGSERDSQGQLERISTALSLRLTGAAGRGRLDLLRAT